MAWVKLDDRFWSNPKVVTAGNDAAGAYARLLSYCAAHLTDGHVPAGICGFICADVGTLTSLLENGLIRQDRTGDYVVPDFLQFNPSRADVEAQRKARAEAGRIGGLKSRPTGRRQVGGGGNRE